MGWFDEQLRQRTEADDEAFSEACAGMAGVVMGPRVLAAFTDDAKKAHAALVEILRYYHVKPQEVPDNIREVNDQLEFLMRPSGIMRRDVKLKGAWYQDSIGALLGSRKSDGSPVAFLPHGLSGYEYTDPDTGKKARLDGKSAAQFDEDAICFYKPLPLKSLGIKDFMVYIVEALDGADFIMLAAATLAATLVGLFTPRISMMIFSRIIPSGSMRLFAAVAVLLLSVSISVVLFNTIRTAVNQRIMMRLDVTVQAAAMMRVLSLPADFFKEHSAGELSNRVQNLSQLCTLLVQSLMGTAFTSLFSLLYITQIFAYAPALALPALAILVLTTALSIAAILLQTSVSRKRMELEAAEAGMNYALISGVQKIRLSGAEKRAFSRWADLYTKKARLLYNPPLFLRLNGVLTSAITIIGNVVLYSAAIASGLSVANFYAFSTAYGMVSGAFAALSGVALTLGNIRPVFDMVKPILAAVPEVSDGKRVVSRISGGIELNNVSFRYTEDGPLILDNLSLKIRPGQYIGIVGPTGCGKSTLMRLLLGFETPQKGAVYYDGKDLSKIDLRSLRRCIGVVMQDGKLFQGDIYSNIVISAPWHNLDDAWKAAEMTGMAEDIRHMPMGMNTLISEGSGGVSGGQRQRLMIARAILPNPRLLFLDEATSALDNITQKTVSDSLASLKCTRIVIAHRLSTIQKCDRILVLDGGHIVEDGSYKALLDKGGRFASLIARQRLDLPAESAT